MRSSPRPTLMLLTAAAAFAWAVARAAGGPRVGVPPATWVLVATALLLTVATACGGRFPRPRIDLPVAVLAGLAASHRLLGPGLPLGHDTVPHLWATWSLGRAVEGGALFPIWLHELGLGMPLLSFYPPAGSVLSALLHLVGLSPTRALGGALALAAVIAAVTMYGVVVRWTGDRRVGLVAAAAYAFAPYRLFDGHYRAALAETMAMAVLPLVLVAIPRAVAAGGARRIGMAAAAVGMLVVSHPMMAAMAALLLPAGSLAGLVRRRSPLGAGLAAGRRMLVVWLLGAATAGIYAVPFANQARFTSLGKLTDWYPFAGHAARVADLVARWQWDGLRMDVAGAPGDASRDMPLYVGLVLVALAAWGIGAVSGSPGAGAHRGGQGSPTGLEVAVVTLLALGLALEPFAGAAARILPPLRGLLFPWRFLAVATCGAVLLLARALAAALADSPRRLPRMLLPGAVVGLLLADAAPYTGAAAKLPAYRGLAVFAPEVTAGAVLTTAEIPSRGIGRVAGFVLPPEAGDLEVGYVYRVFPEYATPRAELFLQPDRHALARAGVDLVALPDGRVERLPAAPYSALEVRGGVGIPLSAVRGGGEIRVALDGTPGRLVVREQAFPGWLEATADGWRPAAQTADGFLTAEIAAGQRAARFRFRVWSWDRVAGAALTLLAVAACGVLAARGNGMAGAPRGREGSIGQTPAAVHPR